MNDYLVYWRRETIERGLRPFLDHAASDQLHRVARGDRLWIVASWSGELYLIGKITVGHVASQQEAERFLQQRDLWDAQHHVIAAEGTAMKPVRIPIQHIVPKLLFIGSGSERLAIQDGKVNGQQLQSMRKLDPASVALLSGVLGAENASHGKVHSSSMLRRGEIYTRGELKKLFGITDATIKNGIFRPKGHDAVWLFPTRHKTRDRTQYHDVLEGDVLEFDGQPQGRTDRLVIDHRNLGLELLVFYRDSRRQYPGDGFRFEGAFEYIAHRGGRPSRFTLRRSLETANRVERMLQEVDRISGRRTSQGIAVAPHVRRALEEHGMAVAIRHFQENGYVVEDVHLTQPVDLICRRDAEVRFVEVKATQTAGDEVLLTPGEVEFARRNQGAMTLFVVARLCVEESESTVHVSGGSVQEIQWSIDDRRLLPTGYRYRVS